MGDVGGITSSPGTNGGISPGAVGPVTAANALATLRRSPTSTVSITDTVQNILANLDALQAVNAKITAITTSDSDQSMRVTATQYQKDSAVLALWGAGAGQTVDITGAKASIAATTLASYVNSVSVSDTSANIQARLDDLQTMATNGLLTEIVQTGSVRDLSITSAQLSADQDALDLIKNHAYTLAIKNATVSDVLGLGSDPALSTNAKVKSITILDTTDAIGTHLDELQRVGLRLKSITQSDPTSSMTVTGTQYQHDKVVLGKITTSDFLAVIDASAAQARVLAGDHKVVTVDVQDTAANISRNWALLQNLGDSLNSVAVSDQANAIRLTSDQYAASETVLSAFVDTVGQSYKLAVTNVSAGNALEISSAHNVDTVDVYDNSANLASSMDDLQTVFGLGQLKSITVANPRIAVSMDVARMQGAQLVATQGVLGKVKGGNYSLAITGAATSDVADLASNKRVGSIGVKDSSANIKSSLDALYQLGGKLGSIEQTDTGAAFTLTQTQMDSRSTVLSKILGGYTVNVTGATAAKAAADARNAHVVGVTVSDTGRNIVAQWTNLRSLAASLTSITKSDVGALSLSADAYQLGVRDNLVSKFDGGTTFAITGASIVQTLAIASDVAVTQIDATDEGANIIGNLAALETLAGGTKLHSIINQTPTVSLALDASELTDAHDLLALVKNGSYTLSLTGVGVAAAKGLLAGNSKIASMAVTGDAAGIVANLSDLNGLGRKLASITQTDADTTNLQMTGAAFEQNASALAKIDSVFHADLTDVTGAKAASYGTNGSVHSLAVSDSGTNLSGAWGSMAELGDKLTAVTQTDSSNIQVSLGDWSRGTALRAKFGSGPTLSVSGVGVSQVAGVASDSGVLAIQVLDTSSAVSGALTALAVEAKLTQVVLDDPTDAMTMSAQTYADRTALLGLVKNGVYKVELSLVTAQDGVTLASDAHVSSMDISDTSAEVTSHFSALAAATNRDSIDLTDVGGTITLTSAQILDNLDALAKINGSYQLAATGVAMEKLADIQAVPQLSSVSISDTAEHVSTGFSDLLGLGGALAQIHLTDVAPVLSLSQSDWTAGTTALATIDGTYHVDVENTAAGSAQAIAADNTVRRVLVADTASNISNQWDTLVSLYNAGAGKLTALSLTDTNSITLTAEQIDAGQAMLDALLPDETPTTP